MKRLTEVCVIQNADHTHGQDRGGHSDPNLVGVAIIPRNQQQDEANESDDEAGKADLNVKQSKSFPINAARHSQVPSEVGARPEGQQPLGPPQRIDTAERIRRKSKRARPYP